MLSVIGNQLSGYEETPAMISGFWALVKVISYQEPVLSYQNTCKDLC
jgi:hypothetical protein